MLKKHMAACLFASALISAPALAQTAGSGSGQGGSSGQFMTHAQPNQWRASKLVGTNIYGSDNQKIGDVNDVLLDRTGKAEAVVIGVGGFLGIGEKDVAIPFTSVEWKMDRSDQTAANRGGAGGTATGTTATGTGTGATASGSGTAVPGAAGTASGAGGTAGTGTMAGSTGTGSTATTTGSTGAGGAGGARSANTNAPDHGVIRMSRADLQNAPTFRYGDDNGGGANRGAAGTGAGTGSGTGAGSTTAPRQ